MRTILLISPYWQEPHRWMVSSVKLAALWQKLGYRVVVACMGKAAREGHLDGFPPAGPSCPSGDRSSAGVRPSVPSASRLCIETKENVSPTLTIYRKKDYFFPDPWNTGISPGFGNFVRRIMRTEKPDTVVINKILFWTSFTAIGLRLRGIRPIVLTDALVGMTWWPRGIFPRIVAAIAAWTVGWAVLLCARVIVFFHPQPPRLLQRLGIAGKSQVIPTGIDLTRFTRKEQTSHSPPPASVVTYIGRLESVKGVDDFLAASVPLRTQFPQIHLQVVGWHADDHPLLARYAREVAFLGLRNDIPAILAATDIFVLPSHSEGLSNALMEAMASGCACIASDVGGNRFLIQNGITGLLFPPGDRAALAAHIRRLISDPAKCAALGAAARGRIASHFSWDVVGKQYDALLCSL